MHLKEEYGFRVHTFANGDQVLVYQKRTKLPSRWGESYTNWKDVKPEDVLKVGEDISECIR